jgi:hypothetical protein
VAVVNFELLRVLGTLCRSRDQAAVSVDNGRVRRTLHVAHGELIAAESSVMTERLGGLLAAEGKLDVELVTPLVQAARAANRFFGDELIAQGLLTPADVARAVERQTHARFDRALQMAGAIAAARPLRVRPTYRAPLASVVVAAFRSRLPVATAFSLVAGLSPEHSRLRADDLNVEELRLTLPELRCWRRLASGQDAAAVLDRTSDGEVPVRLIAALIALGAIGDPGEPVPEPLRRIAASA